METRGEQPGSEGESPGDAEPERAKAARTDAAGSESSGAGSGERLDAAGESDEREPRFPVVPDPSMPPPVPEVLTRPVTRPESLKPAAPGPQTGKLANMGRLWALGAGVAFSVLGGVLIGFGADYVLGTSPIFLLVFAGVGLITSLRSLVKEAQKMNAPKK